MWPLKTRRFESKLSDNIRLTHVRVTGRSLEAAELRRAEARLARAAAARAMSEQLASRQSVSRAQREAALADEQALRRDVDRRRTAAAAQRRAIAAERARMHEAAVAVQQTREQDAEGVRSCARDAARKAAMESDADLRRKRDLIRQLKAAENVPRQRVAAFDRTQSSQMGLLEEMSIQVARREPLSKWAHTPHGARAVLGGMRACRATG